MKRVLITGASGFLGRHCVRLLAQREGVAVHAVSRSVLAFPAQTCRRVHTADLWDSEQVEALLQAVRPTHLLHLAWVTAPGDYLQSADNVRWLEASLDLTRRFARHGGQRIVVAGSCVEYDWSHGLCDEATTPTNANSLYAICKNGLREVLAKWCPTMGIQMAWGRLFFPYGPGEHPNRFVARLIRALLAGVPFECKTPTLQRDFLYVADAAEALVALLVGDIEGTYNIGSGVATTTGALATTIGTLIGTPELIQLDAADGGQQDRLVVAATAKMQEKLAWRAQTSLNTGLTESIRWWRQQANHSKP